MAIDWEALDRKIAQEQKKYGAGYGASNGLAQPIKNTSGGVVSKQQKELERKAFTSAGMSTGLFSSSLSLKTPSITTQPQPHGTITRPSVSPPPSGVGSGGSKAKLLKDSAYGGLTSTNKNLMTAVKMFLPTHLIFGEKDPISKLKNYYAGVDEQQQEKIQSQIKTTGDEIMSQIALGTVHALPSAVMGYLTAGASLTAEGASLAPKMGMLAELVKEMAKHPAYWMSFAQITGSTYEKELSNGANELQASMSAVVNGILGSAIEISGGIEKFNPAEGIWKGIARSAGEEATEEIKQYTVENLVNKILGTDTAKWFSLTRGEDAVINPLDQLEEGFYGGAVGGILGGGQTLTSVGVNKGIEKSIERSNRLKTMQPVIDSNGKIKYINPTVKDAEIDDKTFKLKSKRVYEKPKHKTDFYAGAGGQISTDIDRADVKQLPAPKASETNFMNRTLKGKRKIEYTPKDNVDVVKNKSELLTAIYNKLNITKRADKQELAEVIKEMISTPDTISTNAKAWNKVVEIAKNQPYKIEEVDAVVKNIKSAIRRTPVKITSDLKQMTDFNDLRKSAFGVVRLSKTGMHIDTFYAELNSIDAGSFPESITHPTEQLMQIIDYVRGNKNQIATVGDMLSTQEVWDYIKNDGVVDAVDTYLNKTFNKKVTKQTLVDKTPKKRLQPNIYKEAVGKREVLKTVVRSELTDIKKARKLSEGDLPKRKVVKRDSLLVKKESAKEAKDANRMGLGMPEKESAQAKRAVRRLRDEIVKRGGDPNTEHFRVVKNKHEKEIQNIAKAFGTEAIFIEPLTKDGDFANGLLTDNVIIISNKSDNPVNVVLGHELFHQLEKVDPKAYGKFSKIFKSEFDKKRMETYAEGLGGMSESDIMKEIMSDFSGEMFNNPEIMERVFESDRTLAQQIYDIITHMIDKLKAIIHPDYIVSDSIKNLEKVQDAYVDAMKGFKKNPLRRSTDKTTTGFSMKKSVEETKNLIAVHNLDETNMLKTLELGGFPMPSIAIMKDDMLHRFGNVSVVFGKETIDPSKDANKVYAGDAWTTLFPYVNYKISDKVTSRAYKEVSELLEGRVTMVNALHDRLDTDNISDVAKRSGGEVVPTYKDYLAFKLAYLIKTHPEYQVPQKYKTSEYDEKLMSRLQQEIPDIGEYEGYSNYTKYEKRVRNALRQTFIDSVKNKDSRQKTGFGDMFTGELEFGAVDRRLTTLQKYLKDIGKTTPDIDKIEEDTAHLLADKDYTKWVEDLFDGVIEKVGIRNDTDWYTPSGNRRSFEATHSEYTLDNVVRAMKKLDEHSVNIPSAGLILGASTKPIKSIKDIHKRKGQLQRTTEETFLPFKEELSERMLEVVSGLADTFDNSTSVRNRFSALDESAMILKDIASSKTRSVEMAQRIAKRDGAELTADNAKELFAILDEYDNAPRQYFEAKPRRAVDLSEIRGVVIPDSTSEKLKQSLRNAGLNTLEYKNGNEDDRLAKINSIEDVKFSTKRDSNGRNLSIGQEDYFEKSKVRDSEGRLMAMYHGTPYGGFEIFNEGTYFTPNKDYADIYTNPSASSIRGKYDQATKPQTYSVYLNIEKPFDTRKAKERGIFEKEYYQKYGMGTPLMESGLPDWFDGVDLAEFLQENNYDYDGLILDEGGTGGYGNEVNLRGVSYVIFNPNQVKDVDNLKPTQNENIKLSEKRENLGYHAGDLGKSEWLRNQWGSSRGTGHFGTGTYFVGDKTKIGRGDYANRPKHKVNFDGYNLFKPRSLEDGYKIHDGLAYINKFHGKNWMANVPFDEYYSVARDFEDAFYEEDVAKMEKILSESRLVNKSSIDYIKSQYEMSGKAKEAKMYEDIYREVKRIPDEVLEIRRRRNIAMSNLYPIARTLNEDAFNSYIDKVNAQIDKVQDKLHSKSDSASTLFMKQFGYEGVDVRHIKELDNVQYGSVIYDLKTAKEEGTYSLKNKDRGMDYSLRRSVMTDEQREKIKNALAQDEGYQEIIKELEDKHYTDDWMIDHIATKIKDKSSLAFDISDVYRNFKSAFGEYYPYIKERYLDPFEASKLEYVRTIEKYTDIVHDKVIKELKIKNRSKESSAIQWYGEGQRQDGVEAFIDPSTGMTYKKPKLIKYTLEDLKRDFPTRWKAIVEADRIMRAVYDELLDEVNQTRRRIYPNSPDKLIPKRKDYYRHYREMSTGFKGLFNAFASPANIDPKLVEMSMYTQPKSKWASFMQARGMGVYREDAIGGFLDYIKPASYSIHVDPHITEFRGLAKQIAEATTKTKNANNTIMFLRNYANSLAGKTILLDRIFQDEFGRGVLRGVSAMNNRVKKNKILFNFRSTLSQFAHIPVVVARVKNPIALSKGAGDTLSGLMRLNQAVADTHKNSQFLSERFSDDLLSRFNVRFIDQPEKFAGWLVESADRIGTLFAWNSAYNYAINNQIEDPIDYADDMARSIVAGRGIGEVPLLQQTKVFQMIAPFQLEVTNLWHVLNDIRKEKDIAGFILLLLGNWLFSELYEELVGDRPVLDVIDAVRESIAEGDTKYALARIIGEGLSNAPLGQTFAGMYPEYRREITVGDKTISRPSRKELFGDTDPTKYGTEILLYKAIKEDPIYSLLFPYGGTQAKKMVESGKMLLEGEYSKNGKIRFLPEDDPYNVAKAMLFGKFATDEGQRYIEANRRPLSEKQSETVRKSSDPQKQYETIMFKRRMDSTDQKIKDAIKDASLTAKEREKAVVSAYRDKIKEIRNTTLYNDTEKSKLILEIQGKIKKYQERAK